MKNEERVNIRVVLHDALSKPAKRIQDEYKEMQKEAAKAAKEAEALGEALDEAGDSAKDHADTVKDANEALGENTTVQRRRKKATEEVTEATDENTTSQKKSNKETKKATFTWAKVVTQTKKGLRATGGFFNGYFASFQMFKSLLTTDLAPMIPVLVTGVMSLGAAIIALAGPLGQISSNIVHLLPLYAALGMLMGTTTMAFKGMGGAIEAYGNPNLSNKELEEALEGLGPNARSAAKELSKVTKRFSAIQGAVQEIYFSKSFTKTLSKFAEDYLPMIEKGFTNAAKYMSEAAIYAMELFGGKREKEAFARVIETAAKNAGKLGKVFAEIGRVLLFVTDAAGPVFSDFLDHITESIGGFADNLNKKDMEAFFRDAGEMAKGFWTGLTHFFGGFRGMMKAAKPLTDWMAGRLGDLMERFDKWSNSTEGQDAMGEFFSGMIPNLEAIGNLIGALGDAFVVLGTNKAVAPFINDLADNVIPNIVKILDDLATGILPVFTDISKAFTNFTEGTDITLVQPLIDIMTALGDAVIWVLDSLSGLSPEHKNFLLYLSGLALVGIPVVGVLGGVLRVSRFLFGAFFKLNWVTRLLGGALKIILAPFKFVWGIISKLGGPLGKLAGVFGRFFAKIGLGKIAMFGLKRVLGILLGPIGWVITAVWLLVDAFVWAYNNVEWFRTGVDTVMNAVKDTFWRVVTAITIFLARIPAFLAFMILKFQEFKNGALLWFTGLWISAQKKWGWAVTYIFSPIRRTIDNVVTWFKVMGIAVAAWWNGLMDDIGAGWNKWGKPIFDFIMDLLTGDFVGAFTSAVGLVKGIWEGLKDVFREPIKFFVNKIVNEGVLGTYNNIAGKIDPDGKILKQISPVAEPGWATGGYTGPGHYLKPAGEVHAGEFVVKQKSTNKLLKTVGMKGLNHMNETGELPGFSSGGLVQRPVGGTVTSGFGASRGAYPHAGIDFAVPIGTPVRAAMDGTVQRASANAVSGRTGLGMLLSHEGGRNTYYGHLSRFIAPVGTEVTQGQPIAYSGNTGNSTGPHLHFETWSGGKPMNPANYLGGDVLPAGAEGGIGGTAPNPLGALLDMASGFAEKFSGGVGTGMGADIAMAGGQKVLGDITGFVTGILPSIGDFAVDAWNNTKDFFTGNGDTRKEVQQVAMPYGWGGGDEWRAIETLVQRESSWNKDAANPNSSARGLFQKMTSLHGPVEPTAGGQASWGLNYIKGRYGSPTAALDYHNRNNHYSSGGMVDAGVFDTGGWLMPGQMAINKSDSPEPILNGEQFGWLKAAADSGIEGGTAGYVGEARNHTVGGSTTIINNYEYNYTVEVDATTEAKTGDITRDVKKALAIIERDRKERK